jgi:plastocyanin
VSGGQQANATAITLTKSQVGGPAPLNASVSMSNLAFVPNQVEVRVGGTVTWTNDDQVQHNATGNNFTTNNMNQGQTRSVTFQTAGTFNYSCTLHSGMVGSVTVR